MADKNEIDANEPVESMETEEANGSESEDSSSDDDSETEGKNATRLLELEQLVCTKLYTGILHFFSNTCIIAHLLTLKP